MSPDEKTALELEREQFETEVKAENEKITGVGLRYFAGATRGKSTMNIKYRGFDLNQPSTLPTTLEDFQKIAASVDADYGTEPSLLSFMIVGLNERLYKDASDPIAEHLNPAWPAETKAKFRIVVRNYANEAEVSIEDAAKLVYPGIQKKFLKDSAVTA